MCPDGGSNFKIMIFQEYRPKWPMWIILIEYQWMLYTLLKTWEQIKDQTLREFHDDEFCKKILANPNQYKDFVIKMV